MTARKIAIVGTHRATKYQAPYDDPAWEIWSFSPGNENDLPRADVWFELHQFPNDWAQEEYCQWLRDRPTVWMQEMDLEGFPGSLAFPIDMVKYLFGTQFLNCTAALILAFALTKSPPAIGIWGIEGKDDRGYQLSALRHFLLLAKDRGIEVVCPTGVLRPEPIYGYDYAGRDQLARWPCGIDDEFQRMHHA